MTLLTAWDMASYAHPRIGVWSATLRGVHFLYTSKRKFSYNFIKISQKKGAGHQCVYSIGLSADLPNNGKRFCCC